MTAQIFFKLMQVMSKNALKQSSEKAVVFYAMNLFVLTVCGSQKATTMLSWRAALRQPADTGLFSLSIPSHRVLIMAICPVDSKCKWDDKCKMLHVAILTAWSAYH